MGVGNLVLGDRLLRPSCCSGDGSGEYGEVAFRHTPNELLECQ